MQAAPGQKLLNPFEFAKAMKTRATKQADEAAAALSHARNTVEAKAKEVRDAAFAVRKAEIALANAKDAVETADRRVKKVAADEEASKAAVDAKAQAEAKAEGGGSSPFRRPARQGRKGPGRRARPGARRHFGRLRKRLPLYARRRSLWPRPRTCLRPRTGG